MIYYEDCMETIVRLEDKSLCLVVTSPPYSDVMSYGKSVKNKTGNEYVEWLCDILRGLYTKVTDDGSIIINIGDKVTKGLRNTYIFRLICDIEDNTDWKIYDVYIWAKKNCIPTGSNARLNQNHEYILHLSKTNKIKANIDGVRQPYSESSINRYKYKLNTRNEKINEDGLTIESPEPKKHSINPLGKIPFSVLEFDTASVLKNKPTAKHPAPFHWQLPEFFIKWLTDEGDLVYDPFMGSGTTAYACLKNNREYIGSEINKNYIQLGVDWINIFETTTVKQETNLSELFA